jgi:hypothetical protein
MSLATELEHLTKEEVWHTFSLAYTWSYWHAIEDNSAPSHSDCKTFKSFKYMHVLWTIIQNFVIWLWKS